MTAYELKLEFASKLRNDRTRELMAATVNHIRKFDDWSELTEINGIEIGGKIKFIKKTVFGDSFNFTVTKGVLIAIGGRGAPVLIYHNGRTKRVPLDQIIP